MDPASPPPFSKHLSFAGNARILEIVSTLLKVVLSTPTLAQTSASQTFANSAPFLAFGAVILALLLVDGFIFFLFTNFITITLLTE